MLHYTKLVRSDHDTNGGIEKGDSHSPLIFLHGLLGMSNNWKSFSRLLLDSSSEKMICLVDLRNHGESFHAPDMTYDLMAEDVIDLMTVNRWEKVKLVGHSMGGKVALTVLKKAPELLDRLMVLDMGLRQRNLIGIEKIIGHLRKIDLGRFSDRNSVEVEMSQWIKDPVLVTFLSKNLKWLKIDELRKGEKNYLCWKLFLDGIVGNLNYLEAEIDFKEKILIPTWFVKGNKSDYISNEDVQMIHKIFYYVTIREIEGGHWLHYDNPQALLECFIDFLGEKLIKY